MYKPIEQIHHEYDGQWVYLTGLKVNERGTVIGGEVSAHSESRDNVVRLIRPEDGIYVMYAGRIPEGVSVILTNQVVQTQNQILALHCSIPGPHPPHLQKRNNQDTLLQKTL